jgi:hypothetical protein
MPHSRPCSDQTRRSAQGGFETFALSWGSGPRAPRDDGQVGTSLRLTGALHDVECRDRTTKTLQLQVSEILQSRYRFDGAGDAAADQYLSVLGLGAEAGGKIAYGADRSVPGALGKADLA